MERGHRLEDLVAVLPKASAAIAYADRQHAGQRRKADGAPFILHPLEVGTLLFEVGASDDVIAAGVLHDTIEKTDTDAAELTSCFGPRVASLVLAVSEDEQIHGYAARNAALRRQVAHGGDEALMVFAADKVSKARELGLARPTEPATSPAPPADRRLIHYQRCLRLLEERLPDSPLVSQFRRELENQTTSSRRRLVA
jgi:(p)ppGpp synthase/HD superfamily hydrolase